MLTKTQLKVILILLDNEGHAEWELAKYTGVKDSNLNPILKGMLKNKLLIRGHNRYISEKKQRKGDYWEFPYFLTADLSDFRTLIREIAQSGKVLDAGLVLVALKDSKYLKSLREKFGRDLYMTIVDELFESYPPFTDSRFEKIMPILGVPLIKLFVDNLPGEFLMEDIEHAYEKMISTISEEIPFDEIMDFSVPVDVLLAEITAPNISKEIPSGNVLPSPGPEYYYTSELSDLYTLLSWYKHYKNYFNKRGNI